MFLGKVKLEKYIYIFFVETRLPRYPISETKILYSFLM